MLVSRRQFARDLAMVAAGSLLGIPARAKAAGADADALDEALALLAPTGPEFGGLSNHGPMAAEALIALGRPNAVVPWVSRYRARLGPAPTERNRLRGDEWRGALGDFSRVGDLVAWFDRELLAAPWRTVLASWLPRLVSGVAAVSFHGILRTAHAARSLERKETAARRHELACGLGYWAARYQQLPTRAQAAPAGVRPSQVLSGLERVPAAARSAGSFSNAIHNLDHLASFPAVIDRVDPSGDAGAFLSDVTASFARVYLANADQRAIAFVHGVTGPSAARLLLPYVPASARRDVLRYTWQAAAGLYCALAQRTPAQAAPVDPIAPGRDQLIDRAIRSQDEHAIKLTEACLREHALAPDPIYLFAARDASQRLRAS